MFACTVFAAVVDQLVRQILTATANGTEFCFERPRLRLLGLLWLLAQNIWAVPVSAQFLGQLPTTHVQPAVEV